MTSEPSPTGTRYDVPMIEAQFPILEYFEPIVVDPEMILLIEEVWDEVNQAVEEGGGGGGGGGTIINNSWNTS